MSERSLQPGDEVEVRVPCFIGDDGALYERSTNTRQYASVGHARANGTTVIITERTGEVTP